MRSWRPEDLDRCEHGRHSIDDCFGCGGQSAGNLFLLSPEVGCRCYPSMDSDGRTRVVDGRTEVRIGTMVGGDPIWVTAVDKPREDTGITIDSGDGPPRSITVQEVLDEEKGMH